MDVGVLVFALFFIALFSVFLKNYMMFNNLRKEEKRAVNILSYIKPFMICMLAVALYIFSSSDCDILLKMCSFTSDKDLRNQFSNKVIW